MKITSTQYHYFLFKQGTPHLPNKRSKHPNTLATSWEDLKEMKSTSKYETFMSDKPQWHVNVPHHGIKYPKKKKLCVIFDCSATFMGTSLNDHLLQEPDQWVHSSEYYVLSEEAVALSSDIERMLHQFHVTKEHRNYLCFLWFNKLKQVTTYRMKVHLFGAKSLPGCTMFGLKKLALDHGKLWRICNQVFDQTSTRMMV
jgi:hypothetical protein